MPKRSAVPPKVSLDALLQRTREELGEAALRLGLSGVGRLRKEELARRIHAALKKAAPAGRAKQPSPPPAKKTRALPAAPRAAKARTRPTKKREEPEPETGARSKFDLGSRAPERPAKHIPWGYGQDRIHDPAVDPRRLYAYWKCATRRSSGAAPRSGGAAGTRGSTSGSTTSPGASSTHQRSQLLRREGRPPHPPVVLRHRQAHLHALRGGRPEVLRGLLS